jgi:DNA-binding XRE family transcriptional regulator
MFLRGEGTPPDLVRGAEWLQKAGQRDISDALVWALSRGTPTDEERKRLFSTKNLGSGKFHRNRDRAAAGKGGHMSIPFEKLKARLLANPKVKAEYEALAPEFEIAGELLRARRRAGLSQAQLAARMGTSQSTIARLESGQTLPSTKTLLRYAEATGSRFRVRLPAA